ncbi:cation diffusion facilitator family transporter [Lactiplantibacillus songbeiensis]|uniref:Cation diffusion facilitator family transporter n=1 Tax=Lactiplantibacillus songbeiensis TaxID=2559920 RepID=A0ABW4C2N5_9LACO|nr:cation diffusion facilitator family transporter [Lactiplantibacillus songbeiensis]
MPTTNHWQVIQHQVVKSLKSARRHLWGNVIVYLSLFLIEYYYAQLGHSQTLRADAFNNLSGIVSTGLLLTGLYIAAETHDDDLFGAPISPTEQQTLGPRIQQSRFRFETIYTLISGLIMMAIALEIIFKGSLTLLRQAKVTAPLPIAGLGAAFSGLTLLILWGFNHYWSRKLNNAALIAASRDTFSDALTSLVTVLTVLGTTWLKLPWLDSVASILLGIYIFHSGLHIFQESSLNLVDYFDPYLEERYQAKLESLPAVQQVTFLRAHYDGNLIMLDVTIAIDRQLTVDNIYALTQKINTLMWAEFGVMETNVMVVPADQ